MTIGEVQDIMGKRFVHMSETVLVLYNAHQLCKTGVVANPLLWGGRGHAKTEIAREFLKLFYPEEEIFNGQFGEGTSDEDVIGFLDVNAFVNHSKRIYNYETGFLNAQAAIFDEFLDVLPKVAEAFKTTLMDKRHCIGKTVCFQSRCEIVIGLTNHDPNQWLIDPLTRQPSESRRALLDRFPFMHEVKWEKYDTEHYSAMFSAVLKDPNEMVARMCEAAEKYGCRISPRTAILLAKSYKASGLVGLKGFADLTPALFSEFTRIERSFDNEKKVIDAYKKYKSVESARINPDKYKDITALAARLKLLQLTKAELTAHPAPMEGDLVKHVSDALIEINNELKALSERSVSLITN